MTYPGPTVLLPVSGYKDGAQGSLGKAHRNLQLRALIRALSNFFFFIHTFQLCSSRTPFGRCGVSVQKARSLFEEVLSNFHVSAEYKLDRLPLYCTSWKVFHLNPLHPISLSTRRVSLFYGSNPDLTSIRSRRLSEANTTALPWANLELLYSSI